MTDTKFFILIMKVVMYLKYCKINQKAINTHYENEALLNLKALISIFGLFTNCPILLQFCN